MIFVCVPLTHCSICKENQNKNFKIKKKCNEWLDEGGRLQCVLYLHLNNNTILN